MLLGFVSLGFSQIKSEWGAGFTLDKDETEPTLVLADNYNYYLLTYINTTGMTAQHEVIVRKFDQKNQLVNTYTQTMPKFDIGTLYTYLGTVEEGNGKVAVFTYTYSNKSKKGEVFKHEFDKAAGAFTSTPILSNTIESAMRSGTVRLRKSLSGNFVGIVNTKYRAKNTPESNVVTVFNGRTMAQVWQKEVSFTDEHTTQGFAVTGSGKVVLLRDNSSFKKEKNFNYMVELTAEGQEEKKVEEKVYLQEPVAVTIGDQEYLVAFNSDSRGFRPNDFSSILLYDLKNGKTLANNKANDVASIKEVKDVFITNVFVQNNELHVFTEAKAVLGKGQETFSNKFPDDIYGYGPAVLYVLGFDGVLKTKKEITGEIKYDAKWFHAFGLLNVKGKYYVNTGYYNNFGFLDPAKGYAITPVETELFRRDALYQTRVRKGVHQVVNYMPDSDKLLFLVFTDEQEFKFVTLTGVKL